MQRRGLALVLIGIAWLVGGCRGSSDVAPVTGTVTLDGQPLPSAEVIFQPQDGRPSTGLTDQQGRYELIYSRDTKGAMIGSHTVRITPLIVDDDGNPLPDARPLPAKYNTQSTLTAQVAAGANTIDFPLTSD
jgi:hypothetical protein